MPFKPTDRDTALARALHTCEASEFDAGSKK
jgi:hypothetical protein